MKARESGMPEEAYWQSFFAAVAAKAGAAGLNNVHAVQRDFVLEGTGLADGSQAHAMVFNLLHLEDPLALLREARRVLRPDGAISVIHWRSDNPTPRGPSLAIRPTAEQCAAWLEQAGFTGTRSVDQKESCPYHYGLRAVR